MFTPPFDHSAADPGYIKGYPPGMRENGGQYTHGAIWSVIAFAMLGNGDKARELFSLLNPINHARTRAAAQRYRVEPYVMAGDVYSMRRMWGAAAGPGTPAPPDGCTGGHRVDPGLPAGRPLADRPLHPAALAAVSTASSASAPRAMKSRSTIPRGVGRGVTVDLDGATPQA